MPVYYQEPHQRIFHSPVHNSKQSKKSNNLLPQKRIMFIYVHGNSTTLSALEQIQTYRETIRQKTVIPRTSPETSNYSELCRNDPRKRVSNTPKASARSLYRKPGSQTNKTFINHTENQVRINSVNQQTKSNMTPRQVSCNTQISTYQR